MCVPVVLRRGSVLVIFIIVINLIEIFGREAIRPTVDIEDIIKELNGLNLHGVESVVAPPCLLDIQKHLPAVNQAQPLYLKPNTNEYWLPNGFGQLEIPHGASIELFCAQSFANYTASDDGQHDDRKWAAAVSTSSDLFIPKRTRSLQLRCLQEQIFEWQGGKYEFRQFICAQQSKYTVERTGITCGADISDNNDGAAATAEFYRIGYNITRGRFVETMQVCHSAAHLQTFYTQHRLYPVSVHFQRYVKRVDFSKAGHFKLHNMNLLYTQRHQREQARKLLGIKNLTMTSSDDVTVKLFDNKGLYLSRGHLAAKADLIYATQQRTSFTFFNVAPQWQSFNGGQWSAVEHETRKFVAHSGHDVICYTGNWGVMRLPAASASDPAPAYYLTEDANNNVQLPVPMLYYRVMVEIQRPWRGIALLGVNNPYVTLHEIMAHYVICVDVQEHVPWLQRWILNKNLKKGYLYACKVSDLVKTVHHLPKYLQNVTELLLD